MKKSLLIIACAVAVLSCSKQPENADRDKGGGALTSESSYQRAFSVANMAPELFDSASTKSFGKRVKEGIPIVSENILTKSGRPDTLMFIFNYAGNDGYVIVPNDERKGFVLAYSDNGSFNLADTAENATARYVIENAIRYCEIPVGEDVPETKWSIDQIEYKKYAKYLTPYKGNGCGNLLPADNYDFEETSPSPYPDYYYETVGCIAKVNVMYLAPGDVDPLMITKWGQGYPYNLKAPLFDGENAVAGCVATATAQVVAHHNFPAKYPTGTYIDGTYYGDTDTKISNFRTYVGGGNPGPGVRDYISRLFRIIGDKLNNNWGPNETSAYLSDVSSVVRWLGYTNTPYYKRYNITELEQSLNAGCPVIVSGGDTSGSGGGSHAYVIDGYKSMHRGYYYGYFNEHGVYFKRDLQIYPTPNPPQRYVHINFGWNGSYNGFYLNAVFDTSDRDSWFETKVNYNGNLWMIPFLHP